MKSINGLAATSKNPKSQNTLSHIPLGRNLAAAKSPNPAMKKNSGRMGRCQAENQSNTTQKATSSPTPPIAIQPKSSSNNRWIK
ncbi:MAG: hypothetical protein WCP62_01285 [Planctomycetota bacterium]